MKEEIQKNSLNEKEKCLMRLLFGDRVTKKKIQMLMDGLDFAYGNSNYLLMLSCLGYQTDWKYFPKKYISSFQAIYRRFQVMNSKSIPWLIQQIRRLREKDIPVMLLKGVALWSYYVKDTPRLMSDFDIAIPEEHYQEAISILCEEGAYLQDETAYSATIIGKNSIDLHRWIFKTAGEKETDIWKRAIPISFYGVDVFVLDPIDMIIHQLDNQSRNIFLAESVDRRMKWMYDVRRIFQKIGKFPLEEIVNRSKEFHAAYRVRFMLEQFSDCFPEMLSKEELDRYLPSTVEYQKWLVNAFKFRKAIVQYDSYGYLPESSISPIHFVRSTKKEYYHYQYLKDELRLEDPDTTFLKYFKKMKHIDGMKSFLGRYLPRIGIGKKKQKGS